MNKTFDIDCELNYDVMTPSTLIFKVEAAWTQDQAILGESLTTEPVLPLDRGVDAMGTRTVRVNAPVGAFSIRYCARVHVLRDEAPSWLQETDVALLPMETIPFLSGSRYVESELIFHDAVNWIGTFDRGHARVERICQWVRDNVKYEIGTSLPNGTTRDVLATRTGVCRDYAHVAIALCRALGIPARFVVGHVMWDTPPPDFHALFEAWLGDRWVLFDPTQMAPTGHVIRIGSAHDAAGLPFATIFGSAQMTRMNPLVFEAEAVRQAVA